MSYILRNTLLTLIVVLGCLASIFPVEENLRLGKDLAGGVSLVYTVDVQPGDSRDVVDKTINVLKDRVNPQGLFEISMVQQGQDRVEISMPLPNERVSQLRKSYDAAVAKIDEYHIDNDAFQRVMRLPTAERDAGLRAMADTAGRKALLDPVIEAASKAESARLAFAAAQGVVADQAELDRLLTEAGEAEAKLETSRDAVLDSAISADGVRAALELSGRGHKLVDRQTKEVIELPSPRQRAIDEVMAKMGTLPGGKETLDGVLEAHKAYVAKRRGFDDPAELIRLLQGAGVLDFRIAVRPGQRPDEARLRQELAQRGPDNVRLEGANWYALYSIENWFDKPGELRSLRDDPSAYFASRYGTVVQEHAGQYYMLLHDVTGKRITKAEGEWALQRAFLTSDDLGRPAVGFAMDPRGASLMGRLTEGNLQQPMAMVLDDQVYSTANIQSRIAESGQISGNFSQEDLDYLIKTLNAGSLQARLSERPISQSILAPELGSDNLQKGLGAAWIALIAIGVFMVGYYFFSGAIAMAALLVNAIMILGIMAIQGAAFTLPGIAGVVLTFGTAVDSNVLIYERIREELREGRDMRSAVRVAFKRVGSTIIDANMTNLIVCLVLVYTGTQEIKGFGITLGIGVVATLFCALVVTRLIFVVLADHMKAGPWLVTQLPLVWPGLQRMLTPRVDWMKLFPVFALLSTLFVGLGLFAVFYEGSRLLDSEFRGGTSITLQFKPESETGAGGERMKLARSDVEERVRKIAVGAAEGTALAELQNAEIVPVNPEADGVTSSRFSIRTTLTDEESIRGAIVEAFSDVVESRPAILFDRSELADVQAAPVYGVADPVLGKNFGRPEFTNDATSFVGGVAIVLNNLTPAPTEASLRSRLDHIREDAKFSTDALRRDHALIVLEGDATAVKSAVVLARDTRFSLFEDEAKWRARFAAQEWEIVREGITVPTVLAGVNSFEPAIARTFRAQAIVAVLLSFALISIYVWVRFGSVRYSLAAVVPLIHDTLVAIGLVAMAEIVYINAPGVAAVLQLRPIKIDLGMVAAIMTIIGYSLNDTIVILDRIRENRGKLAYASREVINDSINQTMSRTLVTGGTALVSLLVLYIYGGEGISSFAYTMICGMVVGTYSTIAIAAPIVYRRHVPPADGALDGGRGGARELGGADAARSLPAGV